MSFEYSNPHQYLSELTQCEWQKGESGQSDLHLDVVDHKAREVLGILEDHGISAKLSQSNQGVSSIQVPRKTVDKLLESHRAIGRMVPMDISTLTKVVLKESLNHLEKQRVAAALQNIEGKSQDNLPELVKKVDFIQFQEFRNVFGKCADKLSPELKQTLQSAVTTKIKYLQNGSQLYNEMLKPNPNTHEIEALLQDGIEFNPTSLDQTILLLASEKGQTGVIQFLIEKGHGPALFKLVVDSGGSEKNIIALIHASERLKMDQLLPEILPHVNFEKIRTLYQMAVMDETVNKFFEELVIASMNKQWIEEKNPSAIELRQIERRIQPFLFHPIDDLSKYAVYVAGRRAEISKERFYEIWVKKHGDPLRMQSSLLRPERSKVEAYSLSLERNELKLHPVEILKSLSEQFRQFTYKRLNVNFEGERGQDEGGLGRQFVSQLFSEIGNQFKFQLCDNGLYRPQLRENSEGNFPPLTSSEKETYRSLGWLMMFCLNAHKKMEYPIGMLFDQGVFTAITHMDANDLQKEFDEIDFSDPAIFDCMFALYKNINRSIEDDVKKVERIEKYLKPEADTTSLVEFYQSVMIEPSIKELKFNDEATKRTFLQNAIKKYIVDNQLKPALAPLFEMAKGMQKSPFGYPVDFSAVQRMNPVEFSQRLQGTVSKQDILNKLNYEYIPQNIQSWLNKWIDQADDKKLEFFLFALSGSGALGNKATITVKAENVVFFHTCFNTLDLDCANIKTEQDLNERLEVALAAVRADAGFDTR